MPIGLTRYLAYLVLALAIAALGFGVGWKVAGWKAAADETAALKQTVSDTATQMQQAAAAAQIAVSSLTLQNQATEQSMAQTTQALGEQTHAFNTITVKLASLDAGRCTITAADNGLLAESYQAALGATDPGGSASATAAGEAGRQHAAAVAPAPAHGQPVSPASGATGIGTQPPVH